jgi:Tol biopolymer transport system component
MITMSPVWRPGTGQLSYSKEFGQLQLLSMDGGQTSLLPKGPLTFGTSWTPDGRHLALMRMDPRTSWDVVVCDLEPSGGTRLEPFAATSAVEARPVFSPDGRFIAYASNEKDKDRLDVYVRAFPGPSTAWQVSTDGGDEPRWSSDSSELFYRDERRHLMMSRHINRSGEPVGSAAKLFDDDYVNRGFVNDYDVAPDGRFLMLKPENRRPASVEIAVNWLDRLKAR